MKRLVCLCALALLASAVSCAYGQAGNRADLQHKLSSSFRITTTFKISPTATSFSDIIAFGDSVELLKNGLRMSALASSVAESNTYKNGMIIGGSAKRAFAAIGATILESSDNYPPRTLAIGDRCWIEAIIVQKDAILFKLFTDPDASGMRYRADLKFSFPNKNQVPAPDAALQLIAEVLTVAQQGQSMPSPKSAPTAAALPAPLMRQQKELATPPSPQAITPPPAPVPTISIGQTKAQVIAAFGEPQRKAEAGTKEIFYYSDSKMKVTFINGIVSSID
jgi:hypothetical protein